MFDRVTHALRVALLRMMAINRRTIPLQTDDFEHILHSFPVFARKRKEFFAYLLQRQEEWKAEARGTAQLHREYVPADEPLSEAAEPAISWEPEPPRQRSRR
jgi:hypothetical protein